MVQLSTPNRGMGPPPVRRFLSNYFDLLFSNPAHIQRDIDRQNDRKKQHLYKGEKCCVRKLIITETDLLKQTVTETCYYENWKINVYSLKHKNSRQQCIQWQMCAAVDAFCCCGYVISGTKKAYKWYLKNYLKKLINSSVTLTKTLKFS